MTFSRYFESIELNTGFLIKYSSEVSVYWIRKNFCLLKLNSLKRYFWEMVDVIKREVWVDFDKPKDIEWWIKE